MQPRPPHWRRATGASIALHLSLALVAWWLTRPSATVHVRWFARAMAGRAYEPAELIPIELSERTAVADEPSRVEAPRPSELPERRENRSRSVGGRPEVTPERTSSTSAREPESDTPSGDYSFVREGNEWIYRDPGGSFVATLQPDGGVEFRNKLGSIDDELDEIWNRSGLSVGERKRLLFERWDECDEPGGEVRREGPSGGGEASDKLPRFQTARVRQGGAGEDHSIHSQRRAGGWAGRVHGGRADGDEPAAGERAAVCAL